MEGWADPRPRAPGARETRTDHDGNSGRRQSRPVSSASRGRCATRNWRRPPRTPGVEPHDDRRRLVGGGSLTQRFSFRQSSEPDGDPLKTGGTTGRRCRGREHRRRPRAAGCGGVQRSAPIGGAANGTPRNAHDAPLSVPCTSPPTVVTRHDGPGVTLPGDRGVRRPHTRQSTISTQSIECA